MSVPPSSLLEDFVSSVPKPPADALSLPELSGSQLRALVENAQDLITILAGDGQIVYQSPSVRHVLGFSAQKLVSTNILTGGLLHPDDFEPFCEMLERFAQKTSQVVRSEVRLRHFDRSWRLLESVCSPLPTDSPIQGVVINSRDITERRRTELEHQARSRQQAVVAELGRYALSGITIPEVLRQAGELLGQALEVPLVLVTEVLPDDRLLVRAGIGWEGEVVDQVAIEQWHATQPDGKIGDAPLMIRDLRFSNEYKVTPLKTAGGGAPHSAVSIAIKPDGEFFGTLCVLSTMPRTFSEQDVAFLQTVASMLTSIISNHRAHQAIHAAKEEAEKANRAKSEFLSRISHELRTPLNAILGFGQLLEMNDLDPLSRESTGHILRAGRHLLNLINEVLQISRIETGQLGISLEPVNLREVLEECRQFTRRLAEQRGVQWECRDVQADRFVRADRQRLLQVFLNLVSNAVKYNREGGRVTVSCREVSPHLLAAGVEHVGADADVWCRVEVQDTGWGLDSQAVEQLFRPFIRLDAHRSEIEGTGLGLSLSKALISAMQGHIGVESTPDVGSTFWIELPAADAPRVAAATETVLAAGTEEGDPKPQKVLYIEDNLSNLRLLECILARRPGIQLASAMYGRLGLEIARERRPDLILLDVHLPDVPGWEVLAALQEDPATRDIPVVVISADATSRQVQRLTQVGAAAYLTKPIDVPKLMRTLDEQLGSVAAR